MLYHSLTSKYFLDHEFGSVHKVNTQIKDLVSCLLHTNDLQFFNFISYNRVTYTVGDVVIIKRKTQRNLPLFASINTIVYQSSLESFYLLIENLITLDYKPNFTGYNVTQHNDSIQKLIKIEELAHYSPINSYLVTDQNSRSTVVVPKFCI